MNSDTFLRLLDKANYTFQDETVTAFFENKYYYLNASFDVANNTHEIDFQHTEDDSINLTEDQEETLLGKMYVCYKKNIGEWRQENKTRLQREAKLSLLSASDRQKTFRSSLNNS